MYLVTPGPQPVELCMRHWRQLMDAGDRAETQKQWAQAADCYDQAAQLARRQLGHWHDLEAAVAALSVSHLNLLRVARQAGAHTIVSAVLQTYVDFLIRRIQQESGRTQQLLCSALGRLRFETLLADNMAGEGMEVQQLYH